MLTILTCCTTSAGDDQGPLHAVPNQAALGMPDYVDGSGLIFSMYLERAEEEDKKMAEDWKADADGILIFVRFYVKFWVSLMQLGMTDWFILRCRRVIDLGIDSGYSTQRTEHVQLLSRQYLSDRRGPKSTQLFEFTPYYPTSLSAANLCRLG